MALQIPIENPQTGVVATYWRLALVALDSLANVGRLVLAGYVSAEVRERKGGAPVDQREYQLPPATMAALAAMPPDAEAATVYDVIATAAYRHIKTLVVQDPSDPEGEPVPGEFALAEDV